LAERFTKSLYPDPFVRPVPLGNSAIVEAELRRLAALALAAKLVRFYLVQIAVPLSALPLPSPSPGHGPASPLVLARVPAGGLPQAKKALRPLLLGVVRMGHASELFARLDAEHGFTLDACATAANAKCAAYFTRKEDGLRQPWTGRVWCNPPYGREIGLWLAKAW
jgi:hypothetical protein